MFKRAEERNYGVLIASIVAIVAIVGMVVYFSGGSVGGAVVAHSDKGDAAYVACSQGGQDFHECTGLVCADLCAGDSDYSCGAYCRGRADTLVRNR